MQRLFQSAVVLPPPPQVRVNDARIIAALLQINRRPPFEDGGPREHRKALPAYFRPDQLERLS